jgi:xylan 1,4-beta-xylosidase
LRADWQRQLHRCRTELGFRHVRFHGLLSDDLGTLVCHREEPLYSFFNADSIVDFLLSIGMRPFVELSFMPTMLASGDTAVFKYRGNVTPPRDYGEWAELVRRLASHWIDRFGAAEVRRWPFEVRNEPNLEAFWTGTQAQYFTPWGTRERTPRPSSRGAAGGSSPSRRARRGAAPAAGSSATPNGIAPRTRAIHSMTVRTRRLSL